MTVPTGGTEGFPPQDCRSCGRCCFAEIDQYIRVFGVDWDRMSDRTREHTHFIGNQVFMKMEGGRCTALAIDVEKRWFSCSVYEERPDVCRSLEKGSGHCKADWHEKAGRPDVALERLRAGRRASP